VNFRVGVVWSIISFAFGLDERRSGIREHHVARCGSAEEFENLPTRMIVCSYPQLDVSHSFRESKRVRPREIVSLRALAMCVFRTLT